MLFKEILHSVAVYYCSGGGAFAFVGTMKTLIRPVNRQPWFPCEGLVETHPKPFDKQNTIEIEIRWAVTLNDAEIAPYERPPN